MKHKTILAVLVSILYIPVLSEQMRTEWTFYQFPDLSLMFGASEDAIREKIREFLGEKTIKASGTQIAPNIEKTTRSCPYIKTERIEPQENWLSTSWFVECEVSGGDIEASSPAVRNRGCPLCSRRHEFLVDFWQLDELKDYSSKCRCGRMWRLKKNRFAQVRIYTKITEYTDRKDPTRVFRKLKLEVEVLRVVDEQEFYGKGYFEEEKRRKAEEDEYRAKMQNAKKTPAK